MSRIFARPFWLHLTIWWPIQTGSFSLIRKILHLCMRPSGAECCTPGETEHCSTADFSSVQSLQCCNAMFAVYLFSGSNRSDQCTLCYQVSESCIFCQLIGPLSRDSRFLLVSIGVDCVSAQHVSRMFFLPRALISTLSLSLSLCPHHTATWSLMRGKSSGFDVLQTCVPGPSCSTCHLQHCSVTITCHIHCYERHLSL